MDSRLVEEHNRRLQIEAESLQSNEELRFAREDATQQRMQAAARLRQHEEEVAVLRQQLANKQNSTSSQATVELERRYLHFMSSNRSIMRAEAPLPFLTVYRYWFI